MTWNPDYGVLVTKEHWDLAMEFYSINPDCGKCPLALALEEQGTQLDYMPSWARFYSKGKRYDFDDEGQVLIRSFEQKCWRNYRSSLPELPVPRFPVMVTYREVERW